ncbi:MAG: hypothetical protein V9G19_27760 [Tetrasphaera sp.]
MHIPPGTWVHWFDGTAHTGPTDVTVPAPIGRPALFMRQGAVIPMMASDVDTLSATDDPAVVDETDRATIVRARAIPAGDAAAAGVSVHESAAALTVTFAPTAPVDELRIEIDLRHRANPSSTVSAVTRATGDALTRADAPAALSAGCRDCWNYDPTTGWLRVNVRGAATLSVTP